MIVIRTALQANEVVRKSVHDAGLLVKAATTGATEVWGIVLYELRGRGLLQEVRHSDDQRNKVIMSYSA